MAPSSPTTPFPLYLLPSMSFRRRSSTQSTSTISTSPSSSPPAPTSFLTPTPTANLRCTKCLAHLIPTSCIISKGFTGRHGRAYLVSPPPPDAVLHPPPSSSGAAWRPTELPNTLTHKPVARQLVTGAHTVSDISCRACGSVLGWKYVHAEEETQRYKVGKYILETRRVVKYGNEWEDADAEVEAGASRSVEDEGDAQEDEEVQFDSQDEDECEDLFSGMWSPELARRRRRNKDFRRQ
ncbi:yippee zinc-binding/DNA-binding /Mis18, centromere assembly-domain-containing protein [Boeremia exigua]|uniref:yippee zinc-binding/DNA-binding /Mis18, centromere assembly-domain-containing protein n=1 Tax=Boeremia exigua TaxID=749465 RepID=UPI001E8E26A7|nr:yippee zinc-binding/DNA-binding /Mis18, centromere assembly-domain-containing protein [Boeremia exigua]KAH6644443.1 yippee zinc-binding/DNA-binding /Mis18, centromere assembly-domain-containing protein [Boeremia exigua]